MTSCIEQVKTDCLYTADSSIGGIEVALMVSFIIILKLFYMKKCKRELTDQVNVSKTTCETVEKDKSIDCR